MKKETFKRFLVTYISINSPTRYYSNKIYEDKLSKDHVLKYILDNPQDIGKINRDIVILNIIEL